MKLRIITAVALAFTFAAVTGCDISQPTPMPRLFASGTDIVDSEGNVVVLKGVNLGGWLFNETWITQIDYALLSRVHVLALDEPFGPTVDEIISTESGEWQGEDFIYRLQESLESRIGTDEAGRFISRVLDYMPVVYDDSDLPLRMKLAGRFGDDARDELLDLFQGGWIKESDIEWIADNGFNVVRVPVSYRNLVVGPDVEKPTVLVWNERTFARLEKLFSWCERYRVYAVLDIQEAPGGQNDYNGICHLYEDPEMQDLTVEMWLELARRFGGFSSLAAYSLLAEPMGAPDPETRDAVYDRIVRAIRESGDDHILIIHDGFFGMHTMPDPATMGWDNVVYSTHIFEFSAKSLADYDFLVNYLHDPMFFEAQQQQQVPYYIGSFSARHDVDWAYDAATMLLDWYNRRNWSWSVWTYKRIDCPIARDLLGKTSQYGVRTFIEGEFDRPDVFIDDLQTLREKMAAYGDLELGPNPRLLSILQSAL